MSVVLSIVLLLVGLTVLIVGADLLVRGAAKLARIMGLSAFAIGVTVVAFGTSAPELFASIGAALQGVDDLAIGNVVGSNIANIVLILGFGALITRIVVQKRVRFVELPIMLGITIVASIMMLDLMISRIEGLVLTLGLIGYVVFIIRSHQIEIDDDEEVSHDRRALTIDLLMIIGGVIGLGLGAKALVYGASEIAFYIGVPAGIVGTTIVAFGTSLPELAATIRSAQGDDSDMAVGNIVGSNIFNLLSVLGITALIKPLAMPESMMFNTWVMIGISAGLVILMLFWSRIGRLLGVLFLLIYIVYIVVSYMNPGSA